jgi:AdoMet-dependent heme synthase
MTKTDRAAVDIDEAPFLVVWEVTRACPLACVHCRAEPIPQRDPQELTTEEGFQLIDQVRGFSTRPPLVLTGGDPMRRPDLKDLVRYAVGAGVTVALAPSATAAVTRRRLQELKDAGLSRIALSLDGPTADVHDSFRRVRGSYASTLRVLEAVVALGVALEVNTTVSRTTLPHLESLARRVGELPIVSWGIFFLVRTGRGGSFDQVTADECERVLHALYDLSLTSPFLVKTIEAPHYRRVVWQREQEQLEAGLPTLPPERRRHLNAQSSANDGNGFVFVDHVGGIRPSGFLPVTRGNVRSADLEDVYQYDEIFVRLRHPDALLGKCGRCRFRVVCGGSRARAFAATGALMASDPLCAYDPDRELKPLVIFGHATNALANG